MKMVLDLPHIVVVKMNEKEWDSWGRIFNRIAFEALENGWHDVVGSVCRLDHVDMMRLEFTTDDPGAWAYINHAVSPIVATLIAYRRGSVHDVRPHEDQQRDDREYPYDRPNQIASLRHREPSL